MCLCAEIISFPCWFWHHKTHHHPLFTFGTAWFLCTSFHILLLCIHFITSPIMIAKTTWLNPVIATKKSQHVTFTHPSNVVTESTVSSFDSQLIALTLNGSVFFNGPFCEFFCRCFLHQLSCERFGIPKFRLKNLWQCSRERCVYLIHHHFLCVWGFPLNDDDNESRDDNKWIQEIKNILVSLYFFWAFYLMWYDVHALCFCALSPDAV